ncbi:MAG: type II secretion system F family protein [Acidimicrobiales bacterium]
MITLALSLLAGLGVFYLYTATAMGWTGVVPGPSPSLQNKRRTKSTEWLAQAGLDDVRLSQFALAVVALAGAGFAVGFAMFASFGAALVLAVCSGGLPIASYRSRRRQRQRLAQEAWPQMIEEIRVLTGSVGRSIPQALFEVGARGPEELRPAFSGAQREWLLTTDLAATLNVLKAGLADPTADIVAETLLIAHELGGTDLDQRLVSLAEDRVVDNEGRKDAVARQAGARFARWFTVVVPFGMALVGMSIGPGRAAYTTQYGQILVAFALLMIIGCWIAATRIMRLPQPQRVFPEPIEAAP